MSDLRLKRIQIRNWMTIRTADIAFPEKGLVLVLGSNLAADGKLQSVGSGKTGLGEALACVLVGAEGRFSQTSHYVPDGLTGDTYVRVEAELQTKPLTVELGVKCPELSKTGECLRFQYDNQTPVQRKTPDQTREELCRVLQVTPELANWTVFLDGDKLKFNRMSQENTVNLLMTALGQPPWTEYYERVKAKLSAANRQVALSAQALDSAKRSVEVTKEDIAEAEAAHSQAEEQYNRQVEERAARIQELKSTNGADRASIAHAETEIQKIAKQLKLLEDQNAEFNHQLEIKRQELRDELAQVDQKWLVASEARTQARANLSRHTEDVKAMLRVPKNCPTCGKPWDKAHGEGEIAKAQGRIDEDTQALGRANEAFTIHDENRRGINRKILDIEQQMRDKGKTSDVLNLADLHERNEELIKNLNASIHQRELQIARLDQGVDKTFVNKKFAVVEERKRALQKAKEAVEAAATDLAMDEEAQKVVAYWYKAYGPTGIPNMVLSDAIPPLNRVAQRISSLMTGGTLRITYSATKELVTGESRARLITKVENRIGSKRLEGSSKGEAGLTNLIIAENLSEIGQVSMRVGFRWYDEITGGQDSVVRRSIFAYLKEVAQRLGILIFVVDHHVEAASYADYVLVAEKSKDEGTRYFWR